MEATAQFSHSDTAVISVEAVQAPEVVPSSAFDERLAETYERLGATPGLLETLAGVRERRWWPEGFTFAEASAKAGEKAIRASGVDRNRIGLLIDTSVCRDRLEPSTAVTVHHLLGLPSGCITFDLSNACLGFLNAMQLAGTMIDSGQIEYALIVDGEGSRHTQEATLARLAREETTMADLFAEFASLTLGSGAAGMVLGRHSTHPGSHRVVGGITRADTSHHDICVGTLDQMRTDTRALLEAGLHLAKVAWADGEDRWQSADRYIFHQVSAVHTSMMCEVLGVDPSRVPLTFPTLGNVGPASVPITLAGEAETLSPDDRVMLMGIGSGITAMATEIVW